MFPKPWRAVRRAVVGAGFLVWMSFPAEAQLSAEMNAFLSSNNYAAYAQQRLNEYEAPLLKAKCGELKLTGRVMTAVFLQPVFSPGGIPQSGQWIDQLRVDRCGTPARRNLLMVARGNNQLQAVPLLPGETVTSPILQRDTLLGAMTAAAARLKCESGQPVAIDTKVLVTPTGLQPWKEEWTFTGCDRETSLPIDFTPDGKGGTSYTIRGTP